MAPLAISAHNRFHHGVRRCNAGRNSSTAVPTTGRRSIAPRFVPAETLAGLRQPAAIIDTIDKPTIHAAAVVT
jgi:hypothetical protein